MTTGNSENVPFVKQQRFDKRFHILYFFIIIKESALKAAMRFLAATAIAGPLIAACSDQSSTPDPQTCDQIIQDTCLQESFPAIEDTGSVNPVRVTEVDVSETFSSTQGQRPETGFDYKTSLTIHTPRDCAKVARQVLKSSEEGSLVCSSDGHVVYKAEWAPFET
jgi:hypothetical protein